MDPLVQLFGFEEILKALPIAFKARHAGFPCDDHQYAATIALATSTTSPACAMAVAGFDPDRPLLFGAGIDCIADEEAESDMHDEYEDEEERRGKRKPSPMSRLCAALRETHQDVRVILQELIAVHDDVMWSPVEKADAEQSLIKAHEEMLKVWPKLQACRDHLQAKRHKGRRLLYVNMVLDELNSFSLHVAATFDRVHAVSDALLDKADDVGKEAACTLCYEPAEHWFAIHGSWAMFSNVIDCVVDTLRLCTGAVVVNRMAGIDSWEEDDSEPVVACAKTARDLDRLIEQFHPFVHNIEDKLSCVPFFAANERERLKQLRALATEVAKETIDKKLERAEILAEFSSMNTNHENDSFNGFAEGATLVGELSTDTYRSLRNTYRVDPEEIRRHIWF